MRFQSVYFEFDSDRLQPDAVERFLANSGVPAERLEAVGRGEFDPVSLNDNSTGRRRNRRV